MPIIKRGVIDTGSELTAEDIKQQLGSMAITRNSTPQAFTAAADSTLATPVNPILVADLATSDYKKIELFVDNNSDGMNFANGCLEITKAGVYFTCAAFASFTHSANSAIVGFGLGIERSGYIIFTSRPLVAVVPSQGNPVPVTGGGFFSAEVGDKICLYAATDRAGDVTVTSAEITMLRKL